jgi:hypothetical protein
LVLSVGQGHFLNSAIFLKIKSSRLNHHQLPSATHLLNVKKKKKDKICSKIPRTARLRLVNKNESKYHLLEKRWNSLGKESATNDNNLKKIKATAGFH